MNKSKRKIRLIWTKWKVNGLNSLLIDFVTKIIKRNKIDISDNLFNINHISFFYNNFEKSI